MAGVQPLRGARDAAHLRCGELERAIVAARLHLDDEQDAGGALEGDDVDLSDRCAAVPRDDAGAGGAEMQRGDELAEPSEAGARVGGNG
jgi:hypothetical protein